MPSSIRFNYENKHGEPCRLKAASGTTISGYGLPMVTAANYAIRILRQDGSETHMPNCTTAVTWNSSNRIVINPNWLEQHVRPGDTKVRVELDGKPLSEIAVTFSDPPLPPRPRRMTVTATPGSFSFTPPLVRGDAEYYGHGPEVSVQAEARISRDPAGQFIVETRLHMSALETKGRDTQAIGTSNWKTAYVAEPGVRILRILSGTASDGEYVDSNWDHDLIALPAGELVKEFLCVGDTKGDEAGTRTMVTAHFNAMQLEIESTNP